jgi:hypothetical protein
MMAVLVVCCLGFRKTRMVGGVSEAVQETDDWLRAQPTPKASGRYEIRKTE